MSSSIEEICESLLLQEQNLKIQEIIHIPKNYVSLSLSDTTCLLTIDLSRQHSSYSNNTYSNIYIIRLNNKRNLITATMNKIYSAAQLNDFIKKNKTSTPQQVLNRYGIDKKDYIISTCISNITKKREYKINFQSQKLISSIHSDVKIDCSEYVIISES